MESQLRGDYEIPVPTSRASVGRVADHSCVPAPGLSLDVGRAVLLSVQRAAEPPHLIRSSKGDPDVRAWMGDHYSAPKGFVGRQLVYKVFHGGVCYGAIVAGSATRFLPGRAEFFGWDVPLNNLVNNTFFHAVKRDGRYPVRNFTTAVIARWRAQVKYDWPMSYGDEVRGWETLIELPRVGECYFRDGWVCGGVTKGFSCKRTAGTGTDSWSGKRVWNTTQLRPKLVLFRNVDD